MKVQSAVISLKVRQAKADAAGWAYVMLVVCWHGRVEKSTGLKVMVKHWDVRRECVKKSHPNAIAINSRLMEMKLSLVQRRDVLEERGEAYSANDLWGVDEEEVDEMMLGGGYIHSRLFSVMMGGLLELRGLSHGTEETYRYAGRLFDAFFGEGYDCSLLTVARMKEFADWMVEERGLVSGSINNVLTKVYGVLRHGEGTGVLEEVPEWDFRRRYKPSRRMYCLGEDVVGSVFSSLGSCWEKVDVSHLRGMAGSLSLFGSIWLLNGIAPVDISFLKVSDVCEVVVGGVHYWRVEYQREKTGTQVKALLRKDDVWVERLFGRFMETASDRCGYVFPILTNESIAGGDKPMKKRLGNVFKKLRKWFLKWCDQEGVDVDAGQFSYYTVRHTFASVYANKPGASLRGLATLMGRKVEGIDVYIHQLSDDADLIKATGVVSPLLG